MIVNNSIKNQYLKTESDLYWNNINTYRTNIFYSYRVLFHRKYWAHHVDIRSYQLLNIFQIIFSTKQEQLELRTLNSSRNKRLLLDISYQSKIFLSLKNSYLLNSSPDVRNIIHFSWMENFLHLIRILNDQTYFCGSTPGWFNSKSWSWKTEIQI